jgi:hypothetical protein
MASTFKDLTNFFLAQGAEAIGHSGKNYLAHVIGVYRMMKEHGCDEDLCRAGLFHSIYGTQQFQRFKLPLERRIEVRALIGERAERLSYLNCAIDRPTFDAAVGASEGPRSVRDRLTGEDIPLSAGDFDDLCRVHLYDWLEQVPRSELGWNHRRSAYRRMAERLDPAALQAYERTFANEKAQAAS